MLTEKKSSNAFVSYFYFIRYAKQNMVLGWNFYNKFFCTLSNPWYQLSLYAVRLVKSKQT